jgi:predicted  nucleic acid-binding Zn-ribbon protein
MVRYRVVPRRVIPADYINDLRQRIENLRKAVIQKNEDIEKLKATIRALAKDRAEVLKQKDALEKYKESLNKEKESIESVIKENERLKDENANLSESAQNLHDRISSFEEQLKSLDARIKEYEEKVKSYEELLNRSKEYALQLENVIKQKDEDISKLNEEIHGYASTIAEKESVIAEKDTIINRYAERTSEIQKYLLEIRDLKVSDKNAMLIFRTTLAISFIFGIVGAIFAIFAEPIVVSLGIDYVLRTKVAVTFLAMALPLCMISVTFRLFATRASVFYLNIMGLVISVATAVLFDIYYPDNFLHPFAGTLYFLYILAVAMHFTALLLALPKVHKGTEPEAETSGMNAESKETVPEPSEDEEKDEEDFFKFIDEK